MWLKIKDNQERYTRSCIYIVVFTFWKYIRSSKWKVINYIKLIKVADADKEKGKNSHEDFS